MYKLKPGIKRDPERRWALPDRVFFGHGACHILAGVFLERQIVPGFFAERIIPGDGYSGNHIYVTNGSIAFDYRGYSARDRLLTYHTTEWSRSYDVGWHCALERVEFDLLDRSELNSRKMLGPDQYWGDPVARAHDFIERADHQQGVAKATLSLQETVPS